MKQGIKQTRALVFAGIFSLSALAMTPSSVVAQSRATEGASAASERARYVPHRVYDTRKKQWIDFETLAERANASEMVFVGEQHNDVPGHAMELAILDGIARRRATAGGPVVLSLEMFERDVQSELDGYLSGTRDEQAFLSRSRPWPNYAADYRPLVERARALSWPVVASNVPRPLASMVSRGGLKALDTLNTTVRTQNVAAEISCPNDRYSELFSEVMGGGHGGPSANAPAISADSAKALAAAAKAMTQRFYEAQCVKDETMGESVARAYTTARARGEGALVVHMNGAFHTDYGLGTAERAIRRSGKVKHMVVSIVPVADLDHIDAKPLRKKADYLVFTLAAKTGN